MTAEVKMRVAREQGIEESTNYTNEDELHEERS